MVLQVLKLTTYCTYLDLTQENQQKTMYTSCVIYD